MSATNISIPIFLVLSVLSATPLCAQDDDASSYTFTTLAGSAGVKGSSDGTGSEARFFNPRGVAVDGHGNVYVADTANSTIRKITPDGVVTTFAGKAGHGGPTNGTGAGNPAPSGDGTASATQLFEPGGLCTDVSGNIYVADTRNDTIRKISPDGVMTTVAGCQGFNSYQDGPASVAGFNNPSSVGVNQAGTIYVVDAASMIIRAISPDGLVTTLAGVHGSEGYADGKGPVARFNYPHGLTVDRNGNVYVTDIMSNSVRKIAQDGTVTTIAGTPFDRSGAADGKGSEARFEAPYGIAVDRDGNLFVADTQNSTIRKVTPDGVVTTVGGQASKRGSTDGTGSEARFNQPCGIAVDDDSNLYIADTFNQTIRVGTRKPRTQTIAFQQIGDRIYGFGQARLVATASSGGPIVYSVVSGPAILMGNVLAFTGVGDVTIRAEQGGNVKYLPASATQTFTIRAVFQTLPFILGIVLMFGLALLVLVSGPMGAAPTREPRGANRQQTMLASILLFCVGLAMIVLCVVSPSMYRQPPPSSLKLGQLALAKSDYNEAITHFTQETQVHPTDTQAYIDRSKAFTSKSEYDRAIADADQALQLDPKNTEAQAARNNALKWKSTLDAVNRMSNDAMIESSVYTGFKELKENTFPEDSVRHFDEAIKLKPEWALAYFGRGLAYERKSDTDRATADFKRAAELDPTNADIFLVRREGPNASKDFAGSVEKGAHWVADIYAREGDDWMKDGPRSEAFTAYYQAVLLDSQCMRAYLGYGRYYEGMGKYDDALLNFEKALELDPKSAEIYHYRGQTYYQMGQNDKAIADYDQAIQLGLKTAEVYNNRGNADYPKSYDQAIADYTEAIRLNPQFAHAYYARAFILHSKGDDDSAFVDCNQAIQFDPNLGPAYDLRGLIYEKKGDDDHALADFTLAIQSKYLLAGAYDDRGDLYFATGEFNKALADYTLSIQLDPKKASSYNARAWLLATCPKADLRVGHKAVEDATKACELSQWNVPNFIDTLAAACAEAGDFDNAIKWEKQYLQAPRLSASDIIDGKNRLVLYQARQPYHAEK